MVRTESPTGEMGVVTGRVDFVSMSGGRAQLSIDGKLYSVEQLETVVDNEYMWSKDYLILKKRWNWNTML